MLKLTQEQFQIYLPIYIMETIDDTTVPDVMLDYIIPNTSLHGFISSEMIEVWNRSLDWNAKRKQIEDHISWYSNTSKMNELEDWLQCWVKFQWITDQEVEVEFLDEDMEMLFINYCINNFKYNNGFNIQKDYALKEYETDTDIVRELICID